jgi:hypothetical protein
MAVTYYYPQFASASLAGGWTECLRGSQEQGLWLVKVTIGKGRIRDPRKR